MHLSSPAAAGLTLRSALVLAALQGRGVTRPYTPLRHAPPRASVAARVVEDEIRAPPNDERRYRYVALENGLKVFLTCDPEADKAAAAIEIRAGHFSDPDDMPGLAHFAEHMLFLGTEPFPEESSFKEFLSKHGGQSNAFTGMEATGFHFSVQHTQLPSALERFASFFVAPLLREDSCAREMKAIDSEYRRNLQTDARRVFQLMKTTAAAGHPFTKFSTGNLETLSVGEPHAAVRGFVEREYTADQMHLAVVGRESLDELQSLVAAHFGALRTGERDAAEATPSRPPLDAWDGSGVLSDAQRAGELRAVPVRESRVLRLMWSAPPEHAFAASKAHRLLSGLLASEAEGSLSWLLCEHHSPPLATSLSGSLLYSLSDSSVFGISASLTAEGLADTDRVAELVLGYLALLRDAVARGDASLTRFHEERAAMSRSYFAHADPPEPLALCKAVAGRLHLFEDEPQKVLSRSFEWPDKIDTDALSKLLGVVDGRSVCKMVIADADEDAAPEVEKWYGTRYGLTDLPDATLERLAAARPHPKLSLPPPNNFVPESLELLHPADPSAIAGARAPTKVLDADAEAAEGVRVWHLPCGPFATPRAVVQAMLRTPAAARDARTLVLSQLVVELYIDATAAPLSAAPEAGLSYSLGAHPGGLMMQVSGFSDKIPLLARDLARRLGAFAPEQSRYDVLHEQFLRALRNRKQERPLWHAQYAVSGHLTDDFVHYDDALAFAASDECTLAAVVEHAAELKAALFVEVLAMGNIAPSDAVDVARALKSEIGAAALAADAAPLPASVEIAPSAEGCVALRVEKMLDDEKNVGLELHLHLGEPTVAEEARLLVLSQVASKDAFNVLRTQKQLGYVVQCGTRSIARARGLSVLVQSAVASPPELEAEAEGWLASFRSGALADLSDDDLAQYVSAVATNLEERPKTLFQENGPVWTEVVEGTHRWQYKAELAAAVRSLTKAELLDFFDAHFAFGAPLRRKVSSHCYSPAFPRGE